MMRYWILAAWLLTGACAETASSLAPLRRIVTTEDAAGRSTLMSDGPGTNVVELNGSRIVRLWETDGLPVAIPVTTDLGAKAGNAYRPGFVGSSLYVADIPPGSDLANIPLHKQESMDYIILLAGEIDLVLDGGKRVSMKPGDVLVQAGNNHSWINRGKVTARLLCVTQTGRRVASAG
jgi:mannose-6-phosphate isomerase-like protein (cupin superfamily)